jgi:hypothetical protein
MESSLASEYANRRVNGVATALEYAYAKMEVVGTTTEYHSCINTMYGVARCQLYLNYFPVPRPNYAKEEPSASSNRDNPVKFTILTKRYRMNINCRIKLSILHIKLISLSLELLRGSPAFRLPKLNTRTRSYVVRMYKLNTRTRNLGFTN